MRARSYASSAQFLVSFALLGCSDVDATLLLSPPSLDTTDAPDTRSSEPAPPAPIARERAYLSLPPQATHALGWTLVDAFPQLTFDDPTALVQAPGTDYLLVSEREGTIRAFRNDPQASEKRLVLDLSDHTQGGGDSGLLDFAFHPEFGQVGSPNRAYVYVHYAHSDEPVPQPEWSRPTYSRLSRFSVDLETLVFDPDSELVLIEQYDESVWHQGGSLFFGAEDGFLYLSVGDGGGSNCRFGHCQVLDGALLSGVLRIDVDQRGGSISHPITRQPVRGSTQGYYIPSDNPFVGTGVLEEFYALGLRSPHRMTEDAATGSVWIGEVGENRREEIDLLHRGANFQWPIFEGTLPHRGEIPDPPLGVWTGPLLELPRNEASSVIGGYVYRGARHPELWGKYIFGDFVSGRIWALPFSGSGSDVTPGARELLVHTTLRDRSDGITSFGVDASGELYVLHLGSESTIKRLERDDTRDVPAKLSETGAFTDLSRLEVASGLMPYGVQSALYSDGAEKLRWVSVPEGGQVTFSPTGPWVFPEGSVFVKHFAMARDESEPHRLDPIETRLLVAARGGGYYGFTYKWLEDGSDAVLVPQSEQETLEIRRADGGVRRIDYQYPGPSDCLVCHNAAAGYVLGPRTAQLNGDFRYGDEVENQLVAWSRHGWLDVELTAETVAEYPRLAALDDSSRSLEDRVRSYWESNCSMCHGVQELRAAWDARYATPLAEQGVVGAASTTGLLGDMLLVDPGRSDSSLMFQRSLAVSPELRMPPLGRSTPDFEYLELLDAWIRSLDAE